LSKTTLITVDIKPNIEEEEREELITMPEEDLLLKIKINISPQNIEWLLDLLILELSLKSYILKSKEIVVSTKPLQLNLKNGV